MLCALVSCWVPVFFPPGHTSEGTRGLNPAPAQGEQPALTPVLWLLSTSLSYFREQRKVATLAGNRLW